MLQLLAGRTVSRRVADLGCGDCKLRDALARLGTPCEYHGYDLLPQSADVTLLDLASQRLPQPCDVAVMLGVGEYLQALPAVLRRLHLDAAALVISHTLAEPPRSAEELQRLGWCNHMPRAAFERLLADSGWHIRSQALTDDGKTLIWACAGRS